VPLDGHDWERLVLQALDGGVLGEGRRSQAGTQPVNGLVVQRVDPTVVRVDACQHRTRFEGDPVPLFGRGVVEARVCRNVLVEGAAGVHVDELEAPADAYRRQREVDGRLQDGTLVVVAQRLRWEGIGLRLVAVPG